jgi:hypothetical protein
MPFGDLSRVANSRIPHGVAILDHWAQARLRVREEVRLDMDRGGALFDDNRVTTSAVAPDGCPLSPGR